MLRVPATGPTPNRIPVATWDDAFRLLSKDSTAAHRHWGGLPVDTEFDLLRDKGWLNGSISTYAALRHCIYVAARDANVEFVKAENFRKDSPLLRKRHAWIVRVLRTLEAAIAVPRINVRAYHPMMTLPPDPALGRTELDLKHATLWNDLLDYLYAAQPLIAENRKLFHAYTDANTTRRKKPETFLPYFVKHLARVWWDLTGRPPGRAGEGRVSPFQRFCESALRTMYPLFEAGSLESAVRRVVEDWQSPGPTSHDT